MRSGVGLWESVGGGSVGSGSVGSGSVGSGSVVNMYTSLVWDSDPRVPGTGKVRFTTFSPEAAKIMAPLAFKASIPL